MSEDEYEEYLRIIYGLVEHSFHDEDAQEQLRDDKGIRVDGCFKTVPAPVI